MSERELGLDVRNSKLLARIKKVAREIREWARRKWLIITHYDADGLSSAGTIAKLLINLGNEVFVIRVLDSLSESETASISSFNADVFLFLDLGSDKLIEIRRDLSTKGKVFIVDHHQTATDEFHGVEVVNPELLGLDGGRIGCTSVLSSLIALFSSGEQDPWYLKLGLVGAAGDLQLKSPSPGSINEYLLSESIRRGIVRRFKTFSFFKLTNSPIHKGICWNFDPFIPGLTGREDVVISLLTSANVRLKDDEGWRRIKDLTEEEKMAIAEKVIEFITQGSERSGIRTNDFIDVVYEFPDESDELLSTAESFSSTLNACGRMGREDLAILLALGDRSGGLLEKLRELMESRRKRLGSMLEALKERVMRRGKVLLFDGKGVVEPRFAGSIATILSLSPDYRRNVIVVTAGEGNKVKISARCPPDLRANVNLGLVMRNLALKLRGTGGGHRVAAGADIRLGEINYESVRETVIRELSKVFGNA